MRAKTGSRGEPKGGGGTRERGWGVSPRKANPSQRDAVPRAGVGQEWADLLMRGQLDARCLHLSPLVDGIEHAVARAKVRSNAAQHGRVHTIRAERKAYGAE
eukprot:scaffold23442_cov33-Tisochrysis_lutea.AAC.1